MFLGGLTGALWWFDQCPLVVGQVSLGGLTGVPWWSDSCFLKGSQQTVIVVAQSSFLSLFTMAEKTIKAFRPMILGSERVPLHDLSVAEDSGWREEDGERVDQLIEMIKDIMSSIRLELNLLEARCNTPCQCVGILHFN